MNTPLLTVIIPIFNAERFLDKCICSVLQQSYANLEVILLNDASTDDSLRICQKYAKRDSRVVLLQNRKKCGVFYNRKKGIAHAKGEYIGFVDADDWIEPNMYHDLITQCLAHDCDIWIGGYICEVNGDSYANTTSSSMAIMNGRRAMMEAIKEELFSCCVWDKVYRSSVLRHVFIYPKCSIGEDLLINIQAFRRAGRIGYSRIQAYHYVKNPLSLTGRKRNYALFHVFRVYHYLFRQFSDVPIRSLVIRKRMIQQIYACRKLYAEMNLQDKHRYRRHYQYLKNISCRLLTSKILLSASWKQKAKMVLSCLPDSAFRLLRLTP